MKKKFKRLIMIFIVIAILLIISFLVYKLLKNNNTNDNIKVVDSIEKYGYNLDDRLILTYNDKVIIDDVEKDIDIIKLEILHNKIVDIDIIE